MLSGERCGLFRCLLADGRAFSLHLTLLRFSSPSLTATAFTRFSKALFWRCVSVWSLCYCCFYDVTLMKWTCIDGVWAHLHFTGPEKMTMSVSVIKELIDLIDFLGKRLNWLTLDGSKFAQISVVKLCSSNLPNSNRECFQSVSICRKF